MKKKDIKKKIGNEFESLISSNFDSVISKIEKKKGVIIEMEKPKSNKAKVWGVSLSFAAIILLIAGIFGFNYFNQDKAAQFLATIILDVNPSIEIKVDENEKIIEVNANNKDAEVVIGDMELKGLDLDVATNALLGAMFKNGYIDEAKNSILVTVLGADDTRNKEIQERLANDIDAYFASTSVNGSVISQTLTSNSDLEKLANEYGITVGKAELINKILAANPMYTFEDLVGLSTTDLNLLATSNKNNVQDITTSGTASEANYIGRDKAKEIALKQANIKESNISGLEIQLDFEDGIMVYEVEFYSNGIEYDYDINATTGDVIKEDKDTDYDDKDTAIGNAGTNNTSSNYISTAKAKEIALAKANVKNYYDYDIEFEYENGHAVYEVDFETSTKEYEYIIDAKTGDILYENIEAEEDDDDYKHSTSSSNNNSSSSSTSSSNSSTSTISKTKAKEIVLNHAGVTEYFEYESELDTENGVLVYEIDFETRTYEYEYVINAKTGKIISYDKERND